MLDLIRKNINGVLNQQEIEYLMGLVDGVLVPASFRCIDVRWLCDEGVLQVFIDHDQGIDMVSCVKATDLLNESGVLDDIFSDEYALEVSSPGIDRPLRYLRDFHKHLNQKVNVALRAKVSGRSSGKGNISSVDESGNICIELRSGPWQFNLAELLTAELIG